MAASLWWQSEKRHVSKALTGIGEFKLIIERSLELKGFNNVTVNSLEVAGGKNGCWLSIGHFIISDRLYWEVVMCSSNDMNQAKLLVEDVATTLNNLPSL